MPSTNIINWIPRFIATEFRLYRSESPISLGALPSPIATLGADVRSYIDAGLVDGVIYYYVLAVDNSNSPVDTVYSFIERLTDGEFIPPPPPPEPIVLIDDQFPLNIAGWTDNANSVSTWVATGGGRMRVTKSPSGLFSTWKSFSTNAGKWYRVTGTMAAAWNPGWIILSNGSAAYNSGGEIGRVINNASSGTGEVVFKGAGTDVYIHCMNSNFTSTWIEVDNITATELVDTTLFEETFDANVDNWSEETNAIVTWRSTSGGRMRVQSPTANKGGYYDFDTVLGVNYVLTASIVGRNGGFGYVRLETAAGAAIHTLIDSSSNVIDAQYSFVGTGSPMRVHCYTYSNFWHEFDNISVIDIGT